MLVSSQHKVVQIYVLLAEHHHACCGVACSSQGLKRPFARTRSLKAIFHPLVSLAQSNGALVFPTDVDVRYKMSWPRSTHRHHPKLPKFLPEQHSTVEGHSGVRTSPSPAGQVLKYTSSRKHDMCPWPELGCNTRTNSSDLTASVLSSIPL